ncbi:MAG: VanZ family protein [Acidobacteriia bacterium]|nr:VanZ family protein [Terriglobia bacterium]
MSFKRQLIFWGPVLLWMAFIFWMSTGEFTTENTSRFIEPFLRFLLPGAAPHTIVVIHGFIRKCGHVTEYFVLGLLLFRAFRGDSKDQTDWRWAAWAVVVLILYASSDEFHQSFVPGRTASPIDVGIDTVGGVIAQGVSMLMNRRGLREA